MKRHLNLFKKKGRIAHRFSRAELKSTVARLSYTLSWVDITLMALFAVGAPIFLFALSQGKAVDFSGVTGMTDELWRHLFAWLPGSIGLARANGVMRICSAVGGGITALLLFLMIRAGLPIVIAKLSEAEFFRIRRRLYFWFFGIPLTIVVSLPFVRLFSTMTPEALRVSLSSLIVLLVVIRHQRKAQWLEAVAYALLGMLSAMSVLGFLLLACCIAISVLASIHSSTSGEAEVGGYGYGYGGYGHGYGYGYGYRPKRSATGDDDEEEPEDKPINENKDLTNAFVVGRMRWLFTFLYLLTFGGMFAFEMLHGRAHALSVVQSLTSWASCMRAEFNSIFALNDLVVLAALAVIPLMFASSRIRSALDTERILGTLAMYRHIIAEGISVSTLLGIGFLMHIPRLGLFDNAITPLLAQLCAGFAATLSVTVFLVDMLCRDSRLFFSMEDDEEDREEGQSAIRRSERMMMPFVFLATFFPVALVAVSLFLTLRFL